MDEVKGKRKEEKNKEIVRRSFGLGPSTSSALEWRPVGQTQPNELFLDHPMFFYILKGL